MVMAFSVSSPPSPSVVPPVPFSSSFMLLGGDSPSSSSSFSFGSFCAPSWLFPFVFWLLISAAIGSSLVNVSLRSPLFRDFTLLGGFLRPRSDPLLRLLSEALLPLLRAVPCSSSEGVVFRNAFEMSGTADGALLVPGCSAFDVLSLGYTYREVRLTVASRQRSRLVEESGYHRLVSFNNILTGHKNDEWRKHLTQMLDSHWRRTWNNQLHYVHTSFSTYSFVVVRLEREVAHIEEIYY